MSASSYVLPVSETIVSTIRSALSVTHFWARRRIRERPSKPSASHPGCAARARATTACTSSADSTGTVAMTSPVAGFSTGMPSCATVAITRGYRRNVTEGERDEGASRLAGETVLSGT
jgi:hypothetical protein